MAQSLDIQSIARAFEHCVIRCNPRNVNHVTILYDLIYIKLPCEPVRKAACLEDWITQQITQYANVQTQSTVHVRFPVISWNYPLKSP